MTVRADTPPPRRGCDAAVVGCGWLGTAVARRLVEDGFSVVATTASSPRGHEPGVSVVVWRWPQDSSDELARLIEDCETVVVSLPFRRRPESLQEYPRMMQACWRALTTAAVERVVVFGSTAVYPPSPDPQDESSLNARPVDPRAAVLWDCERLFLEESSWRSYVLRLGGLYGPGRPLRRMFDRKASRFEPNRVFNLIHRDDVVAAVQRLFVVNPSTDVFNVVADEHPTYAVLQARIEGSKGGRDHLEDKGSGVCGKIIRADKIKRMLGLRWSHPRPSDDLVGETADG